MVRFRCDSWHFLFVALPMIVGSASADSPSPSRRYINRLLPIDDPKPLLNDHPEFVAPISAMRRFEAPPLVIDNGADLHVRAWRFSYNARGVIEMPNHLRAKETVVIMVHPWGIDDGQGWRTPEPAGVADFCTPEKNHLAGRHTRDVIDPLLKRLRPHVAFTMYSMRAGETPIHRKLYRSIRNTPSDADRIAGREALHKALHEFRYEGAALPDTLEISTTHPVIDYFQQFPGLDASAKYNNAGFWDLPVPVCRDVTMDDNDIVIYDADGYSVLRDFLRQNGVRHVILTGYATDMCFCKTTAGYENLSRDFNVFLVGDATLATFPANDSPRHATNAHIAFAALNQLITQTSWIELSTNDASRAK